MRISPSQGGRDVDSDLVFVESFNVSKHTYPITQLNSVKKMMLEKWIKKQHIHRSIHRYIDGNLNLDNIHESMLCVIYMGVLK